MGVTDRSFRQLPGGVWPATAQEVLVLNIGDVAQGVTDTEYASIRVPYDCQVVSAYAWARAVGSTAQTVELQDDGTDISDPTAVAAASTQTAITGITSPTRLKAGSELQVMVDTSGGSESFTNLIVTVTIRPYPLGEAAVAVA